MLNPTLATSVYFLKIYLLAPEKYQGNKDLRGCNHSQKFRGSLTVDHSLPLKHLLTSRTNCNPMVLKRPKSARGSQEAGPWQTLRLPAVTPIFSTDQTAWHQQPPQCKGHWCEKASSSVPRG